MERGGVAPETHQYFKMEDFDSNPSRVLVEMNYLLEMFDLERVSEKGTPVVITLREKPEHFNAREGKCA